jgi:hypothetical protein
MMQCKGKFIKIFAILVLGLTALNLSLTGALESVTHRELKQENFSCSPTPVTLRPGDMMPTVMFVQSSDPLAYLFQIIFILFFISPPLIVILLFLIWRELRSRNKLK